MAEEKKEYYRWLESRWNDPDRDWKKAEVLSCGIDVGSVSSQCVILADGELYAYSNMRTGSNSPNSARDAFNYALDAIGDMDEDRIDYCIGTGYVRAYQFAY